MFHGTSERKQLNFANSKFSMKSNSSLEYAAEFADVVTTGSLEFCGEKRKLRCDLVMASFFTPELKRFLAHNRMLNFK